MARLTPLTLTQTVASMTGSAAPASSSTVVTLGAGGVEGSAGNTGDGAQ